MTARLRKRTGATIARLIGAGVARGVSSRPPAATSVDVSGKEDDKLEGGTVWRYWSVFRR